MEMIKVAVFRKRFEMRDSKSDMVEYHVSELIDALVYEDFDIKVFSEPRELLNHAKRGSFSQVYINDLDDLGLAYDDLLVFLRKLDSLDVRIITRKNKFDTLNIESRRMLGLDEMRGFLSERRLEYAIYYEIEAERFIFEYENSYHGVE